MPDLETQIAQALVHLEYLREDVTEIKADVKAQNGRVRKLETGQRNSSASWGAGAGAALGGALTVIWHWFSGAK